jgi:hypothetical protein
MPQWSDLTRGLKEVSLLFHRQKKVPVLHVEVRFLSRSIIFLSFLLTWMRVLPFHSDSVGRKLHEIQVIIARDNIEQSSWIHF